MTFSDPALRVPPDSAAASLPPGWLDRWWALALVCLAAITPLLVVDFPPLVDLYGHLGRYAVQTELAERPELQAFYSYEWKLIGNLGADLLIEVLHPLLGLETSVRCVVILTQLLGALGLMLVAREVHGRVTAFCVAAIVLLYGYPFNYGFINFALSMALGMLAFVVWLRWHRAGRAGAAQLWLGAAGAAIWVCHTYGWAFLGLLAGSAMLAEVIAQVIAGRLRLLAAVGRIIAACWPLLLPVIPMVIWRAESSGAAMSDWSLPFKLMWLTTPMRTMWQDLDIGALWVIGGIIALALLSRAVRIDRGVGIAALLCFVCYAAMPSRVFGSAFADMRLVPYAYALTLVAIGPVRQGSRLLLAASALALALFAGRMAITTAAYIEQDRKVRAVLPALDELPMGARVAFFVVKPCWASWALPVLDHVAGAALARRNAFVNDQWQQPGVNPMTVHYPAAKPFVSDPSHLIQNDTCSHTIRPGVTTTLARVPQGAFTHVWIVGQLPADLTVPEGFERVPYRGAGVLFRLRPGGGGSGGGGGGPAEAR